MNENKIRVGFDNLPDEIVTHLRGNIKSRIPVPHVYHVTSLIGCLRSAYFKHLHPDKVSFDIRSLWNIYRGITIDRLFSPLFEINQRTYRVSRLGVEIVGTLDFVVHDREIDERVIYDLKCPAIISSWKKSGVGRSYRLQVQSYDALAKANGDLRDVCRLRVLLIADDVVREEFILWPEILDKFLWPRAFLLDAALGLRDPSILPLAEEGWRCDYCDADEDFQRSCDVLREKLSQMVRAVGVTENQTEIVKEMEGVFY